MAFLSGLKAAYDTLGSEITKTFDSSRESQGSVTEDRKNDQELPAAGTTTTGEVRNGLGVTPWSDLFIYSPQSTSPPKVVVGHLWETKKREAK